MKTMNIYAKHGDKVRFSYPDNGYERDKENAKNHLRDGEIYTVKSTSGRMFVFDTYVLLKEIPNLPFNSVQFEDVREAKCYYENIEKL